MVRSRTWIPCLVVLFLACGTGDATSPATDDGNELVSARISRPAAERVVAIGDVHGDYAKFHDQLV